MIYSEKPNEKYNSDNSAWDRLAKDDRIRVDIKSASDLEKLSTVEQLKNLSKIINAADAETWYAVGDAKDLFDDIENDTGFSPLIRIIAKEAKSLDPNDGGDSRESRGPTINEDYGYHSIVTPEMMPDGVVSEEVAKMDEVEIKAELDNLESNSSRGPDIDDASYYNELESALAKMFFLKNQDRLHQEFPSLPKEKQLVKIASDAAATVEFQTEYDNLDNVYYSFSQSIDSISDSEGHIINDTSNSLDLDDEAILYLKIVHGNDFIKSTINKNLGFNITEISLEAQVQLLKFMAEARNKRFDSLCSTLHKIEPKARLKFAESFLAADFGEDFGDALLDIAGSEHISGEQLGKILDGISSCRESIKGITGLYRDFDDGDFAKEYARAANERLTDVITAFREIAKKGEAKAVLNTWRDNETGGITGQRRAQFDLDEAMEALNYEVKSLAIISGTIGDVIDGKIGAFAEKILSPEERHHRSMYNLYSPDYGYVLLYVRPEGSSQFEPSIEYGKFRSRYDENGHNVGTEASISMIANPVNPFSLPNPFRPDRRAVRNSNFYDPTTMDKVSAIRLDREGRAPGVEANDEARSPINKAGVVSVDLAAINDRADTPSGKIARLLSVGNRLRAGREGADFALNHNTRWFEQEKYGTEDGFAQLARYVDTMANSLCEIRPPVDGESFTQLRQQSRKRKFGRKVLGEAA